MTAWRSPCDCAAQPRPTGSRPACHRRAPVSRPASVSRAVAPRQARPRPGTGLGVESLRVPALHSAEGRGDSGAHGRPALRRIWRQRILDHDGNSASDGGIARWLHLTDALGLTARWWSPGARCCPARALRCRRTCTSCAKKPARSDRLVADRIVRAQHHRPARGRHAQALRLRVVRSVGLFRASPDRGATRFGFRAGLRQAACRYGRKQALVKAALHFKCSVLWAQLDALHVAYVTPGIVWPDAFVPDRDAGRVAA